MDFWRVAVVVLTDNACTEEVVAWEEMQERFFGTGKISFKII